MCGRFSLTSSPQILSETFKVAIPGDLSPRYNIAPGQPILSIRQNEENQSEAAMLHWGLIPGWAKDSSMGYKMINVRAETVAEKPSFRAAYRSRHCLIPADGFYEWKAMGRQKQPYLFSRQVRKLFTLAGLWEHWTDPQTEEAIQSCTIITTAANDLVAPVHHRMPVVIGPEQRIAWLDTDQDTSELLSPHDWPDFISNPVSTYLNSADHEGPDCHAPPDNATPLFS